MPRGLHLCVSLADQNVATTKSIGIYNFSTRVARELADADGIEKLTLAANRTIADLPPPSDRVVRLDFNGPAENRCRRVLWDQSGVYSATARTRCDWLFLPKGFASFLRRPPAPLAAYVHDTMGEHYRRNFPGYESRLEYEYFARSLAATLRHASLIFTNTEFTRSEILSLARRWRIEAPPVIVAGYGFDAPAAVPVDKENSVLLFASKVPHKKTDLALAFLEHWLQTARFDGRINCIGIISDEMRRMASPAWNWIGRVSPETSREMIRKARAVVYFSDYEGFGMPPVEAALEGTCPVYSAIPPICEVMGRAGRSFSNSSSGEFADAMNCALATRPDEIATWGRQLLAHHNWPGVIRRIVDALQTTSPR